MTISIDQVTTTVPTGNGVFDVLMRSVDSHLDKQYVSGRIKGNDYATVYLGALQAVLQQAMQFVLMEQEAEKKLAVMDAQIASMTIEDSIKQVQSNKDLEVKSQQITSMGYEDQVKQAQKALIDQQKLTEVEQTKLVDANTDKVSYEVLNLLPKQVALLEQQELTETQQTRLVDANADAKEYEVINLLPEQLVQLQEQIDLLQSQDIAIQSETLIKEEQSAIDTAVKTKQIESMGIEDTVKQSQKLAIDSDKVIKEDQSAMDILLKNTEKLIKEAQAEKDLEVKQETIEQSKAGTVVKQLLGDKQADVYTKQAKGLENEGKFKMVNALLNVKNTAITQDREGVNAADVNKVIGELYTAIGFTTPISSATCFHQYSLLHKHLWDSFPLRRRYMLTEVLVDFVRMSTSRILQVWLFWMLLVKNNLLVMHY
jgi:hypothetical protein